MISTFNKPEYFINRELSWLEFNARVLEEAADPKQPLLERLRFLCIFSSNLDEFFEIRVAGIKQQIENGSAEQTADGLTPLEVFEGIEKRTRQLVDTQYKIWAEEINPALKEQGIFLCNHKELTKSELEWCKNYFDKEIFPVLTPLAVDSSHPFPQLVNKCLNLILTLKRSHSPHSFNFGIVQIPRILPRLITLPGSNLQSGFRFILLSELIVNFLDSLFPGDEIQAVNFFRITRNSELYIDEEEAENLLQTVEEELKKRNRGNAVRLEIESSCSKELEKVLLEALHLDYRDSYRNPEPLNFLHLLSICNHEAFPHLRDRPWTPVIPAELSGKPDLFEVIRKEDILLHHPFESFGIIVDLLQKAAVDPSVLGIRMTLYRTSGDSPIVHALIRAAQNGKQVTALVEIKARFDEENNILWAKRMEEAGIHVLYGIVGLKTHCKMLEIIRRDPDGIRLYVHLATGNYHPSTARLYTDLSLLTTNVEITKEVATLFNILTGLSRFHGIEKLIVSPFNMARRIKELILREIENAKEGKKSRIIAKINALVDEDIIQHLYAASTAGVKIDLIVRGICCLRPGVPKVSENIRVISIVGRFLEHSRIFYFENGGNPEFYSGSADWMQRNFYRRIEIIFPIEDPKLKEKLNEILNAYLSDNVKARELLTNGKYKRLKAEKEPFQAQLYFREKARKEQQQRQSKGKEGTEISIYPIQFLAHPKQ